MFNFNCSYLKNKRSDFSSEKDINSLVQVILKNRKME